jgi:hypothetical protein
MSSDDVGDLGKIQRCLLLVYILFDWDCIVCIG